VEFELPSTRFTFASMEKKLPLYEHGHQLELQALENVIQTPLDGPFDHEDLLWEVVIRHTRMQQGPTLLKLHSSPQLECLIS
jgi:hypothetical protein